MSLAKRYFVCPMTNQPCIDRRCMKGNCIIQSIEEDQVRKAEIESVEHLLMLEFATWFDEAAKQIKKGD